MSDQAPVFVYEDESHADKLARKSSEAPFFPIGTFSFGFLNRIWWVIFTAIGVCTAAVLYGAYAYKKRGAMSTSVYLMQLRVGAQGLAVGTLTVGLAYTMFRDHFQNKTDDQVNK